MAGRAGHPLRAGRRLTPTGDQTAGDQEAGRVGATLVARLDALSALTDVPGELTRLYLTPAHKAAALQVAAWMHNAGLTAWIDDVGNVVGRTPAAEAGPDACPVVILGAHIDTVRLAGRYDGAFGALAALAAPDGLRARREALRFAVEVVAFGDEESVRFPRRWPARVRWRGASIRRRSTPRTPTGSCHARRCDLDATPRLSRVGGRVAACVEAHIEQGPVLEAQSLPLGVVTAIAGATRLRVRVAGTAGHAGTVTTSMRHDALMVAAAMVIAVEQVARHAGRSLVATVGQMLVSPVSRTAFPATSSSASTSARPTTPCDAKGRRRSGA